VRARLSTGEFGVLRMLGGNIPGDTRVLSVAIYDHAQTLEQIRARSSSPMGAAAARPA